MDTAKSLLLAHKAAEKEATDVLHAQQKCAHLESVIRNLDAYRQTVQAKANMQRAECERLEKLSQRLKASLAEVNPTRLGILSAKLHNYSTSGIPPGAKQPELRKDKFTQGSGDDDGSEGDSAGGSSGESAGSSGGGGSSKSGSHGTSTATIDLKDSQLPGSAKANDGSGSGSDNKIFDGQDSAEKTSSREAGSSPREVGEGHSSSTDMDPERDISLAEFDCTKGVPSSDAKIPGSSGTSGVNMKRRKQEQDTVETKRANMKLDWYPSSVSQGVLPSLFNPVMDVSGLKDLVNTNSASLQGVLDDWQLGTNAHARYYSDEQDALLQGAVKAAEDLEERISKVEHVLQGVIQGSLQDYAARIDTADETLSIPRVTASPGPVDNKRNFDSK